VTCLKVGRIRNASKRLYVSKCIIVIISTKNIILMTYSLYALYAYIIISVFIMRNLDQIQVNNCTGKEG